MEIIYKKNHINPNTNERIIIEHKAKIVDKDNMDLTNIAIDFIEGQIKSDEGELGHVVLFKEVNHIGTKYRGIVYIGSQEFDALSI